MKGENKRGFWKAGSAATCLGWLAGAVSCARLPQAQAELWFTNRFLTYTNLEGEKFSDAELIEAESSRIIFKTNGIFGAEAFTNLSPETLERLGITPAYLDSVREEEKKRSQAMARNRSLLEEEQRDLLTGSNLIVLRVDSIQLSDYDPTYGTLQFCQVTQPAGITTSLFMARLPAAIPAYYQRRAWLAQRIAELQSGIDATSARVAASETQLGQAQSQVDQANATPRPPAFVYDPINQVVVNAADAVQNRINQEQANINQAEDSLEQTRGQITAWREELSAAQSELDELARTEKTATTVRVVLSHFRHNGYQIVLCRPPDNTTGQTGAGN